MKIRSNEKEVEINTTPLGGKKMNNWILLLLYTICTVGGLILFKYGANQKFVFEISGQIININISFFSIVGLTLYLCSFILYIFILAKFDITYILPLISVFTTIGIYVLSIIVLNEPFNWFRLIGAVIIVFGAFVVNVGK